MPDPLKPLRDVANVVSDATDVNNIAGKVGYYANAWVTLSIAVTLFVIGIALIFSKQLAAVIGTGAMVAGPGKIGTAVKVASVVGGAK